MLSDQRFKARTRDPRNRLVPIQRESEPPMQLERRAAQRECSNGELLFVIGTT
jgi:hypothetical protein